jgi:RNA-directed DNA polymerase
MRTCARWVLEGDIKKCFDMINHQWLLNNIPMDKSMLAKWLRCGFIDKNTFFKTDEGTPQGGIISPTLLNLTLKGLEARVKTGMKPSDRVNVVIYADDFVITGDSKELLEQRIKPVVTEFLKERGLTLSPEKTLITHIDQGFDFLGFNMRMYGRKLLIKPSKNSIKTFLKKIRTEIKSHPTSKAEHLIFSLNRKIIGWVNYFRHSVAKKVFVYVDYCIFRALWAWACRRHPNKNKGWIWKKYFSIPGAGWGRFSAKLEKNRKLISVFQAAAKPIRRHVKIKSDANPFDPEWREYYFKREASRNFRM